MPTMKIEALTEHYQTRRKTALNRVPVEPEKFARPPPGRASRKTLIDGVAARGWDDAAFDCRGNGRVTEHGEPGAHGL